MANYAKKIRTDKGDLQIDYTALANLPKSDTELKEEGGFADAKVVGDKLLQLAQRDLEQDTRIVEINTRFAISNFVTAKQLENKGYITADYLNDNQYAKKSDISEQFNQCALKTDVTSLQNNYTALNGDVSALQAAVEQKAGRDYVVASIGNLTTIIDELSLEDLVDVHVVNVAPSTLQEGHWYLIKAEE